MLALVLAQYPTVKSRRHSPTVGAFVSLSIFLVLATNSIDLSPSHRGLVAAAVVIALLSSLELNLTGPMAKVLSHKTTLYLGTISYGIYLWHWPIILVLQEFTTLSSWPVAIGALLLASAFASLSYHLVEQPIRSSPSLNRRTKTVLTLGIVVPVAAAVLFVPRILETDRRPVVIGPTAPSPDDLSPTGEARTTDPSIQPVPSIDLREVRDARIKSPPCEPGEPRTCVVTSGDGLSVVIVGDSHAQMYLPALEDIAERNDWKLSANVVAGCPWQVGLAPRSDQSADRQARCESARGPWYENDLAQLEPDVVVLAGRSWDSDDVRDVIRPDDPSRDGRPLIELFDESSRATIELIEDRLAASIVLIEPTPLADIDPLVCLSGAQTVGQCAFESTQGPTAEDESLRDLSIGSTGVVTVDFDRIVCPDSPKCIPVIDGVPVWRDDHHLSVVFARDQSRTFEAALFRSRAFDAPG